MREEGECKALRIKCALARELKAKMEDQEARMSMRDIKERQKSKRKEEERQMSKRKEEEGSQGAVRRELQEELYLARAWWVSLWLQTRSTLGPRPSWNKWTAKGTT